MSDLRVLITGAGTATCQSVVKGLRAQHEFDVEVITADMQEDNAGRWFGDRFIRIPAARDEAFVPALLDACRRCRVNLLIPIVDYEFEPLAHARRHFEELGCRLALSAVEVVRRCSDKWQFFQFCRAEGFPVPQTWLPEQLPASELRFPVYVKPRLLGRGSLDTYRADSREQLACFLQRLKVPLVQEALAGREFTIDVLCDFAGRALNGVVRERVETKAGVSSKGRTVRDAQLLDLAVAVVERLPVHGPANVQCFRRDNDVWLLEVNPRYSGALALSIAAGFNSPLWLLKLVRGETVRREIGNYREGVSMLRYWQEVFLDAEDRRLPGFRRE
jgi:carbamoyl-phosphate synthase large subunit